MRWVLVVCMLAGCALYFPPSGSGGPPDASVDGPPDVSDSPCMLPPPPGNCVCTATIGWACSTCPFYEGSDPVACSTPGASCQIETWEHGCDCGCGSDGWWHCTGETVGSRCPTAPPPDGGVIDAGPPDAPPPDAGPCSPIEAESVGDHDGWSVLDGDLSGGHGLTADAANASFAFHFVGNGLVMHEEVGPNRGTLHVSIDGGAPVIVNAYRAGDFVFVATPIATGLPLGDHAVTVTCASLYCSVDYFDVPCE